MITILKALQKSSLIGAAVFEPHHAAERPIQLNDEKAI